MYKYIKTILILIPILALFYLFNKQFPLNGKLEIVYDFKKPNAFISHLYPIGRLSEISKTDGKHSQTIKIDPVYFDLELPANYQTATIQMTYQSKARPIIEIGALASKNIWNFQIQPMQNLIIDELIGKWDKTQKGETILLQREKKYNSIDSFIENLPLIDEIAVFNYNLPYEYIYPNYEKSDEYLEIQQKLKGQHSFYTYLGDGEDMDFSFWIEDLNERNGSDEGEIEIYRGSELIKKQIIPDDGIVDENKTKNDSREWKINLENPKSGLYKINLLFPDDILINKIKTKQKLIAFVNKLNLCNGENPQYSIRLFSNSSLFKAAVNSTSGFQTVKVDGQELDIQELNIEYIKDIENAENGYNIEIPKGSILISGDGLFSFGAEQFFNPRIKVLNKKDNLDGINYIIANYHPPILSDGWIVGKTVLNLLALNKENNKVKIIISAPNLNRAKGEVIINEIRVILETRPFFTKVRERLYNVILSNFYQKT
ncbi:MAG: hypothetical protein ABIC82_03920 [bacterium]